MLTPADIFKALALLGNILFLVYLILFPFCLRAAWKFAGKMVADHKQRRWLQIAACLVVTVFFISPFAKDYLRMREYQAKQDEFQARYNKAKAIFDERCKTAGEKIYHTAEGVEGITLLNVPQKYTHALIEDPMWEGAALPHSGGGDNYIRSFLNWEIYQKDEKIKRALHPRPSMRPGSYDAVYPGYQYVDVRQNDNTYLRYRYPADEDREDYRKMITEQLNEHPARYAVEFKPIIDPADRQYWVAGLTINVYDTKENILMASKTWYSMEPGQGNRNQRVPWAFADICPKFYAYEKDLIPLFVHQALKPKQGD
jgi:hypothetical protein